MSFSENKTEKLPVNTIATGLSFFIPFSFKPVLYSYQNHKKTDAGVDKKVIEMLYYLLLRLISTSIVSFVY